MSHAKFLMKTFAALSSTGAAATNAFLDILSSNPELRVYESLREEAAASFTSYDDWRDPAALKKLICTDSAIRESLRRNPIQVRGLLREVVPKSGLTLPDGNHIPRGTWVGVPVQAVHMDDRSYSKPDSYDPFRFARMRTKPTSLGQKHDSFAGTSDIYQTNIEATQPSYRYLAYSYGRYAW